MVARPGRYQAAFTAGELDPALHGRTSLKYYGNGAKRMENVVPIPQGGFELADGLRHVGRVNDLAEKGTDFTASTGAVYDLIFSPGKIEMWLGAAKTFEIDAPYTAEQLGEITFAQRLDTLIVFHPDVQPRRVIHKAADVWEIDLVPFKKLPDYDYGGTYTNGVDAVWELSMVGVHEGTVFILTVSNADTTAITNIHDPDDNPPTSIDQAAMIPVLQAALNELTNVEPTIEVTAGASSSKFVITFKGNPGDDWAISGRVLNAADAAITAYKKTPGKAPGEPIISATRGWPSCGCFYQQRLLIGGLRGLPNNWGCSITGDYFNFDERLKEANGSFFISMDLAGGERITRMVPGRNLLLFTTEAEYWLAERELSKKNAPNHVQSSRHGSAPGVPIVENEGAALFVYAERGEIGEYRYTDTDASFSTQSLSLLGSHLVRGARDLAIRRAGRATSGNLLAVIGDEGLALATLLREQDVTGFGRRTTDGDFRAVWANGLNQLAAIVDRPVDGVSERFLERFEVDLLLDGAVAREPDGRVVEDLGMHEGATVWALDGRDVFGPFVVTDGAITLDFDPAGVVTVGRWRRPVATTLPPPRDVGPNIAVQRPARIHSAQVSVEGTTSLALATNDGAPKDVPLRRFGDLADVGELEVGATGIICQRGFTGFVDEPTLSVTQMRPGRLRVRAVTAESSIG